MQSNSFSLGEPIFLGLGNKVCNTMEDQPKAMNSDTQTLKNDSTARRSSILQPQTSEHVQVGEAHGEDFPFILVPPSRLGQQEDYSVSSNWTLKPRPMRSFESFSSNNPFYQEPVDHTLITNTRFFISPKISPKSPRTLESMFGETFSLDGREPM